MPLKHVMEDFLCRFLSVRAKVQVDDVPTPNFRRTVADSSADYRRHDQNILPYVRSTFTKECILGFLRTMLFTDIDISAKE